MMYGADPAARNEFRSTAAHNTLQLDRLEQQEFDPRDLFAMHKRARAEVGLWQVVGTDVSLRGSHVGYASAGWRVVREIHGDLNAVVKGSAIPRCH